MPLAILLVAGDYYKIQMAKKLRPRPNRVADCRPRIRFTQLVPQAINLAYEGAHTYQPSAITPTRRAS
jgi:hypothetical protein